MARFAPVVPLQIANVLQGGSKDLLGRYHLLLAHDVLNHPSEYRSVYAEVRRRHKDAFIIMDNSIIELGAAMKMDDLIDAAETVKADCIVIPDEMGDGAETRNKARAFIKDWEEMFPSINGITNAPCTLMGVIHGDNVTDCLATYDLYLDEGARSIGHVAVPRVITEMQGSRMPVLCALADYSLRVQKKGRLHLLGFSDDLLDDVACARLPFVSGIDSAVPIRAGMNKVRLDLNPPIPQYIGPRGDFWNRTLQPRTVEFDIVECNLTDFRTWIGDELPQELS